MHIILAPDSYKGSLTAVEVVDIVGQAAKRVLGDVQLTPAPIADGGEGTVEAIITATGGSYREAEVTGPLGQPVRAHYGLLPDGQTAVLEMAQASGLPLMPSGVLDPLRATSRGTGELLLHALDTGAQHILLGIGGSATNDGGLGFLSALGVRFTSRDGGPVPEGGAGMAQVASASLDGLDERVRQADITVLSDVTNLLLGPTGATYVYGPQKGVTEALRDSLEAGMRSFSAVLESEAGRNLAEQEGAGAAGGIGMALLLLGCRMRRGIDAVLDTMRFDSMLDAADLVVTGEGRMDGQSVAFGKGPAGVKARATARGVPTLALVGGMTPDAMAFLADGMASVMTTVNAPMPVEEAIASARALLDGAAERMFCMLRIGMDLRGKTP